MGLLGLFFFREYEGGAGLKFEVFSVERRGYSC